MPLRLSMARLRRNARSPPLCLPLVVVCLLALPLFHVFTLLIPTSTPTTQLTWSSTPAPLQPLRDAYASMLSRDKDSWCEARYGLLYLEHLALNHIPYCDVQSSTSDVECFRSIRDDLFCMLSSVQYTATRGHGESGSHKPFSMNCKRRNLTQERLDAPEIRVRDTPWPDFENFKKYMYDTGIYHQIQSFTQNDGRSCNRDTNDERVTILVRREATGNIWHRLVEFFGVMDSIDVARTTDFFPKPAENKKVEVQVVFQDDTPGPWDELLWPALTGERPLYISELNDTCLGTVILPLTGHSSILWDEAWSSTNCTESELVNYQSKFVLKHLGLDTAPRLAERTMVTIINRTHTSNTRQLWNIDAHTEVLRRAFPDVIVQVLDFASIPLRDQIEIIRNTDVLVGAMGAGLTHMLFLHAESAVAEILAPGAAYFGFRNLAKFKGNPYFSFHGVPKEHVNTSDDLHPRQKRHWQNDEYLYMTEKQFIALVSAAINAQGNRGATHNDVKPQ